MKLFPFVRLRKVNILSYHFMTYEELLNSSMADTVFTLVSVFKKVYTTNCSHHAELCYSWLRLIISLCSSQIKQSQTPDMFQYSSKFHAAHTDLMFCCYECFIIKGDKMLPEYQSWQRRSAQHLHIGSCQHCSVFFCCIKEPREKKLYYYTNKPN